MPETLDIDQTVEIIKSSGLEDLMIINENYECILNEMPSNEDKTRIVILQNTTQQRIQELVDEHS